MNFSIDQVIAIAKGLNYKPLERAEKWLERLAMNGPEFQAFEAFPEVANLSPYSAIPTHVEALTTSNTKSFDAPRWKPRAGLEAGEGHKAFISANALAFEEASVPVAVKDLMRVKGFPLTGGTKETDMKNHTQEASIVSNLRGAGASIVATTNLHELAYGVTSRNPHHHHVVNAVNPELTPGGSSGGSAVAVALGIVPFAIGTDTAGSIRIPAACNGVVGFKPSYGALSTQGVISLGWSLDHVGPIAIDVEWTAWAFAAMLGLKSFPDLALWETQGLRLGFLGGYFEDPVEAICLEGLETTRQAASKQGYKVTTGLEVRYADSAAAIQLLTLAPEATTYHLHRLYNQGEDLGEDVRVRLEAGLFLPGFVYPRAQAMRQAWGQSLNSLFDNHDILVTSTLRCLPPEKDAIQVTANGKTFAAHTAMTQLTMPFNLSGNPAITLPLPRFGNGLAAIQLIGRKGEDWRLLAVAKALEARLKD